MASNNQQTLFMVQLSQILVQSINVINNFSKIAKPILPNKSTSCIKKKIWIPSNSGNTFFKLVGWIKSVNILFVQLDDDW